MQKNNVKSPKPENIIKRECPGNENSRVIEIKRDKHD